MPAPPAAADGNNVLVYRLVQLLIKLNQGKKLDPQALAEEFGVTRRTLQRDLNERLAYLPLEKIDGRYRLNPAFLGKISARDIEHFASLAGVRGLFPSLSADFLRDVFDARIQSARLVKGPHYEDLGGRKHGFETLETTFTFDSAVGKTLRQEDGIWLNETRIEVVLTLAKDAPGYFKHRPLVAHQVIDKELADGGLIVSARVAHINQILPIVRHWIPHVRIISPPGLQAEMEREIRAYLAPH